MAQLTPTRGSHMAETRHVAWVVRDVAKLKELGAGRPMVWRRTCLGSPWYVCEM